MHFSMKKAYTIKEAQRDLATITRHNQPVAYLIGAERLAAIAETMELLAIPAAMRAIRDAEAGKGRLRDATDLPE